MACHLGYDKTLNRIMARFYWSGIRAEVCRWCASCPECQLVNPPAVPRAPLRPLPLVEAPFDRIGMDIIGPLERSAHGYRFVLVLIDYATRYPEAIPLRNISAKNVAEYWQIPLSPAAREKMAFSTLLGLYQFKVLPFGLFGAPATFQRLMGRA